MRYKDYYKILNISKTAAPEEIKKAYRALALKYHPDKNPGNLQAEEQFKEVNEAYNVLSDPDKKQKYDNLGSNWEQYADRGTTSGGNYGHSRRDSVFSDFFESIFGFAEPTGRRRTKGHDYKANISISLEDAFHGTSRIINANGKRLNVNLKPGIKDGQVLKMTHHGAPGTNGGKPGDLYVTVNVNKHRKFTRKENDLYADEPLNAITAMLGGNLTVGAIDKSVKINIPEGTDSNKTFRLKNMGMPDYNKPGSRGDYYARVVITVPKNLSETEKNTLRNLKRY